MMVNDWHERDRVAMRIYRFNEWVKKAHPDADLRFSVFKDANCPPEYIIKIDGNVYYEYDCGFFDESNVADVLCELPNDVIFKAILENPPKR